MNFSNKILLLVLIGILTFTLFLKGQARCDSVNFINASLELVQQERKLLGFNTDRDGLHFGKVSPGATVTKTIFVNYTVPAEVIVTAAGSLSPWLAIEPQQFEITPLQTQEVTVQAIIPETALAGNYTGSVEFCFRE